MRPGLHRIGWLLLSLVAVGTTAYAFAPHHDRLQHLLGARFDAALSAANPTAAQRTTVDAARDRTLDALADLRQSPSPEKEMMNLFTSDQIDPSQLAALRTQHEDRAKQAGDALVQLLTTTHDTLDTAQRKAVVDYLRGNRPHREHHPEVRNHKDFVKARVNAALDAAQATTDQRTAILGAVDQMFTTMSNSRQSTRGDFDRALSLFEADQLDTNAIAALRTTHQNAMKQVGDAMSQLLMKAHDTLSATQRQEVAQFMRSHHGSHSPSQN
jgi:uncharacterized membrane protein